MEEKGWVIERYLNSKLYYWEGERLDDVGFVTDHARALRFARQEDASKVLSWLLNANGRVAEHVWVAPPGRREE